MVNVLIRNIKAILIAGRYEYILADITPYLIAAFISLETLQNLLNNLELFILGLIVMFVAHFIGTHINTLSNYASDLIDKPRLSRSVDIIGERNLLRMFLTELILGTLLVFYLTLYLQRLILLILWWIGCFFAIGYSIRPIRFKRQPFLGIISRVIAIYVAPILFGWFLFRQTLSFHILLIALGYAIAIGGMFPAGELKDYWGDLKHGDITASIALGPKKATITSLILVPLGGIILILTFGWLALIRSPYPWFHIVFLSVALLSPIKGLYKIYSISEKVLDLNYYKEVKKEAEKHLRWLAMFFTPAIDSFLLLIGW